MWMPCETDFAAVCALSSVDWTTVADQTHEDWHHAAGNHRAAASRLLAGINGVRERRARSFTFSAVNYMTAVPAGANHRPRTPTRLSRSLEARASPTQPPALL
ncbi:hypothetical protein EW145_g6276 [Phellinidium pouzarii]|uniref:Uncharacterized protein n=1 Tax=Phellinidium pouzarii TaxID=167371 RepID=A0A4S4L1T2_9AGAM|nr:hypothetical protein EW145_g6276 [Phellinidium pouzarii]